METLSVNFAGKLRREKLHGREYLVAPMSLIVPGVLSGSKGALYYPAHEVSRNPENWNGMPVVLNHPTVNGRHVSARSPEILEQSQLGAVYNARIDAGGKLKAEGWFDIERTRLVDSRILDSLESQTPIELSTGLFTRNEPVTGNASFNGVGYTFIARDYRPDHLAILPDVRGACSIDDGCGVLVNGTTCNSGNPNQPRKSNGQFGSGGGGGGGGGSIGTGTELSDADEDVSKLLKPGQEQKFIDSLTSEEVQALREWKNDDPKAPGGAIALAGKLREKSPLTPEQEESYRHLQSAFKKAPRLNEDTVVYRGTSGVMTQGSLKSPMSTSSKKSVAQDFAGIVGDDEIVYAIKIPKGTKVLPTRQFALKDSTISGEAELLLPPGLSISIGQTKGGITHAEITGGVAWATGRSKTTVNEGAIVNASIPLDTPEQVRGACSIDDGCGVLINMEQEYKRSSDGKFSTSSGGGKSSNGPTKAGDTKAFDAALSKLKTGDSITLTIKGATHKGKVLSITGGTSKKLLFSSDKDDLKRSVRSVDVAPKGVSITVNTRAFAFQSSEDETTWALPIDSPEAVIESIATFNTSGIPEADMSEVRFRLTSAWRGFHPHVQEVDIPKVVANQLSHHELYEGLEKLLRGTTGPVQYSYGSINAEMPSNYIVDVFDKYFIYRTPAGKLMQQNFQIMKDKPELMDLPIEVQEVRKYVPTSNVRKPTINKSDGGGFPAFIKSKSKTSAADEMKAGLKKIGYSIVKSLGFDFKTKQASYEVKGPDGKSKTMTGDQLKAMMKTKKQPVSNAYRPNQPRKSNGQFGSGGGGGGGGGGGTSSKKKDTSEALKRHQNQRFDPITGAKISTPPKSKAVSATGKELSKAMGTTHKHTDLGDATVTSSIGGHVAVSSKWDGVTGDRPPKLKQNRITETVEFLKKGDGVVVRLTDGTSFSGKVIGKGKDKFVHTPAALLEGGKAINSSAPIAEINIAPRSSKLVFAP